MPRLIFMVGFLCVYSSVAILWVSAVDAKPRPNVVLIMTDNHGAWTLGCYGNNEIRTPNIDQLAAEGTLFTRAFASNPVCSPTRATCLTGLMPSQHGVHSFLSGGNLQTGPKARSTLDSVTSLPEVLRAEGYRCGLVGKWHLGGNLSPQEGFDDYWITMPHGGTSTFYGASIIEDGKQRNEPQYLTDFWTDHAVKFISKQTDADKPFFLFLAYNGPYSLSRLLLREGQNRHAEYYRDKDLKSFPTQPTHPWQFSNRDYINNPVSHRRVATEVSGVDDGVGRVMQTLKERGLDDNTIVIFVADQGWVGGHGGFYGMGDHTRPLTARDGMMQIPLIFRHPEQIAKGIRSDQMIANYDIMPTLLGHLNLADKMPTEPKSPGRDFSSTLKSQVPVASRSIFYEYENLRCIRAEDWKYVHRHPNGPHELYDLKNDADEFHNLVNDPKKSAKRDELRQELTTFFAENSVPKYDLYIGGTSQVRIHDGIDEEIAQLASVDPPPLTKGFTVPEIQVPDGYTVELAAGPPLVTHPTLGCFDDTGNLFVCNNAGVNLTNLELEEQLPNSIVRLADTDNDGRFDRSTVFADKMTFPMGGAWHDGSLYVASPPCIWKLTDTNDDGVADQRTAIVKEFGYNGNAASIHGCFFGPDGRLYWCDGFHGHELKDDNGKVVSKREGSYIFSCRPDGSDVQILAGGGMDNPVEIDWMDSGDALGTVNILYTRPRVDCLVHWLHGGAYPHREKVRAELKVTGDFLGPAHRFGHVAISGMTRYRSGVMDHRWKDNLFATFFNQGKVVRLQMQRDGSTWAATQHEFLSSTSRDFHPTDVIEDADGSLLVVDTGGWFYRGCPTSQFAKPELLGGIYRVRRSGMTPMVDPRGNRIDWASKSDVEMTRLLNDTRFVVRHKAVNECVRRGAAILPILKTYLQRGDIRVRQNCLRALLRLAQQSETTRPATQAIALALTDDRPDIRQFACRALGQSLTLSIGDIKAATLLPVLNDSDPAVRREAATTLGKLGDAKSVKPLLAALAKSVDRSEEHACIYALIQINQPNLLLPSISQSAAKTNPALARAALIAIDQSDDGELSEKQVVPLLASSDAALRTTALSISHSHPQWTTETKTLLLAWLDDEEQLLNHADVAAKLISKLAYDPAVAQSIGDRLLTTQDAATTKLCLNALADSQDLKVHGSWLPVVRRKLGSNDMAEIRLSLDVVQSLSTHQFDQELDSLAGDLRRPPALRFLALRSKGNTLRQAIQEPPSDQMMELIHEILENPTAPDDAMSVAQWLPSARLTTPQLAELTKHFSDASPMLLRELIRLYGGARDTQLNTQFLADVGTATEFLTLPEHELSDVVKRFPHESLPHANELLDRLKTHRQAKQQKLAGLLEQVQSGDIDRGRKAFFSENAKCASCHRIAKEGKQIGPDLTTIGANRSASDLLESIVLPSSSIVRDYGTFNVLTDEGKTVVGLLAKETSDTLTIQQSTGDLVEINRDEIEQVSPSTVSIMPNGLDESLTKQQLVDIVAYLRSLR
ncbi:MAG: PVC-type heme-binding CxxCH protein [Pirellulaceae bacterium]